MAHHHLWRGHESTNMNILIANTPKIYNVEYIQVLNILYIMSTIILLLLLLLYQSQISLHI